MWHAGGLCSKSELVIRMAIWGSLLKKRDFFQFLGIDFFTNCERSRTSAGDLRSPMQ